MIGMLGVSSAIFLVIILLTSRSPLVTGVLSSLIFLVRPLSLKSNDTFPAYKKVEIKFSTISLILTLTIYSF